MSRLIDADELLDFLQMLPIDLGRREVEDIRAHIREMPEIESEQQWIPCSERLPEDSGRYLISVLDGVGRRTTVAPYQPRYKVWTMTGRMAYWRVVAWMPLPEPYGPEE